MKYLTLLAAAFLAVVPSLSHAGLEKVIKHLRDQGMGESSEVVVAIDFTKSNEWNGAKSFGGKNLHDVSGGNHYSRTIRAIVNTMKGIDADGGIRVLGFGDETSGAEYFMDLGSVSTTEEAVELYENTVGNVKLSGPTNFGPVIREVTKNAKKTGKHHLLLIITDGAVEGQVMHNGRKIDCETDTIKAIIESSAHPVSIVAVGVGDGDSKGEFPTLVKFDDNLKKQNPAPTLDNFQSVQFTKYWHKKNPLRDEHFDEDGFATKALEELPKHIQKMKEKRIL